MSKKLIKFFLLLCVLGALGVGILLWNINPIVESFRPQLAQLISDTIKQPTEIGGINLKLFPTQAIELKDISLAGGSKEGASIKKALLDVNLMALLKKNLEVTQVSVDGLKLNVTREKDGSLNVGGLPIGKKKEEAGKTSSSAPVPATGSAPTSGTAKTDSATPNAPASSPPAASAISFQTKSLQLKSGNISIHDQGANPPQTIELSDINVDVQNITQESVEKLLVTASLLGKEKNNLSLSGSVQGLSKAPFGVEPNLAFSLKKIDLEKIMQIASAYGVKVDKLSLKDSVDFKLSAKGGIAAPEIEVSFDGKPANISFGELFQKAPGSAFGFETSVRPKFPANVEIPKFLLHIGASEILSTVSLNPLTKTGKLGVKSSGIQMADLNALLPMLKPFGLGGSVLLDINTDIPAPNSVPKPNGSIELKGIEASTTLPAAEGQAKPEPLLVKDLNGKIELQGDSISIKGLKLNVDGQPLEIGAKVAGLPAPAIQYALRTNKLNFGPLLKSVKAGGIDALNGSSLDGLQVSGGFDKKTRAGNVVVNVDKGEFANLPLAALKLSADFTVDESNKPLTATLQPSTLGIFGGTVAFQGGLSASKQVSFQSKISKIDIKRALEVLQPNSKLQMTGTMDSLNLQITASQANVPETISGPVSMLVSNGSIEGVNIVGQALSKVTSIPGLGAALLAFVPEKYAPLFKADRTAFDRFTADVQLNGATINIKSFKISQVAYEVAGEGTMNKAGKIDLHAQLTLNAEMASGMVAREPRLKLLLDNNGGIVFPIQIIKDGSVPVVIPDVSKLAKMALQNTAKQAATQLLNKGLDKVSPGLGGALKGLF